MHHFNISNGAEFSSILIQAAINESIIIWGILTGQSTQSHMRSTKNPAFDFIVYTWRKREREATITKRKGRREDKKKEQWGKGTSTRKQRARSKSSVVIDVWVKMVQEKGK